MLARELFARAWEEIAHELTKKQLEALRLDLFEGLRSEDIAQRLDVGEQSAKSYISTAMGKLRSALYRLRYEDN
jgi:DNA-directed RNA polymerase specialized sigma24 family protein